ncbi:MAG: glycosyltransferase family 2 protein, partial [Lachnospiraceae bacterium]|nr:glycosyltransferase family 2 protein [Lachnospiraceae bacterium]
MAEFNYALEPGKYLKRKYDVRQVIETGVPLISVVTAYYNAGTYFEQTFYSVLNQTFPWFEWIIVDDGSTNEKDIAKLCQMAESDGRIKVLHQENEGAVSARNKAITYSVSDVIVILDADDLIDCRYLEMVYWGLLCNPQAAWAYTDSVGFDHQQYIWEREFSSDVMKRENVLSYIAAIRKEVLTDGIYDNRTRNEWEDWQLWLKLLAKGYRPFHIKKKMFWYRRLDTGMLSKIEKDEKLRNRLKAKIETLAQNVPDGICAACPDYTNGLEFARVKVADWDRKLPYRKKKVHILFLLPHMECGGADLFNLDI